MATSYNLHWTDVFRYIQNSIKIDIYTFKLMIFLKKQYYYSTIYIFENDAVIVYFLTNNFNSFRNNSNDLPTFFF